MKKLSVSVQHVVASEPQQHQQPRSMPLTATEPRFNNPVAAEPFFAIILR